MERDGTALHGTRSVRTDHHTPKLPPPGVLFSRAGRRQLSRRLGVSDATGLKKVGVLMISDDIHVELFFICVPISRFVRARLVPLLWRGEDLFWWGLDSAFLVNPPPLSSPSPPSLLPQD